MNKKMGELKVNKSVDYYNKIVKTLEDAGFVLVLDYETTSDRYYIVAKKEVEDENDSTESIKESLGKRI